VTSNGRTLAYSGDSGPTEELAALARGADLFLCEATLAEGVDDGLPRGHLSASEALAAADGPVLLTHRPVELPAPDGVQVAHDGLVVEV
jgi:ribonuclease BN (tRNA processing enzyme)